jgi:lambda family phage portal protein
MTKPPHWKRRGLPATLEGFPFRKPRAARMGNVLPRAAFSDGFAAGKRDRLTDDWIPGTKSPNVPLRMDADLMRNRARDLVINNPYALAGVQAYVRNVIGCGISPKPAFPDRDERKAWVEQWNWWCGEYQNECDITEMQHYYELQALWLEEIIVGGGVLQRFVTLEEQYRNGRSIPLAIELIPDERMASEKDDLVAYRNRQKSANPIIRGVEIEQATGRPVAFWVRPNLPGDLLASSWDPIRYDAENCRYSFFKKRIGQTRGYTMLHAAIMWLWKLGYYVDNELMASAIKSCYALVIEDADSQGDEFAGLEDDDPDVLTDTSGNPLDKLEPGIIAHLRKGAIKGVGPNTPTNDQEAWILLMQRAIAVAMGLSYEENMRDYSRGSFSSTRASSITDRQGFRMMQTFTVNHQCRPTYNFFARASVLEGIDGFPSLVDFAGETRTYLKAGWRLPGRQSVNPFDDARAGILEIKEGLGTREEYLASKGLDWEDVDEQLEREAASAVHHHLAFAQTSVNDATLQEPGGAAVEQQLDGAKPAKAKKAAAAPAPAPAEPAKKGAKA